MSDLVIRGGTVVTSSSVGLADIAVTDGRITAVGSNLSDDGKEQIDATGLHVFPGGIDSHVHFNEPGRTEWETIANGSSALAAGGYTSFVDMPLNNLPVTIDGAAFDLKLEAAKRSSIVDFGFWGGLVPGNQDRLAELVNRGVIGFKAFMCPSGIDEFPACDEKTLREGMKRIAELDSILLVHAEDPSKLSDPKGTTARDFLESRPWEAELAAVHNAIAWAREAGCRLHIVHVSWAPSAALIQCGTERRSGRQRRDLSALPPLFRRRPGAPGRPWEVRTTFSLSRDPRGALDQPRPTAGFRWSCPTTRHARWN